MGNFRLNPGQFEVRGTHEYAGPGVLPVTVTANYYADPVMTFGPPVYSRDVVARLTAIVSPSVPTPVLTGASLAANVDRTTR